MVSFLSKIFLMSMSPDNSILFGNRAKTSRKEFQSFWMSILYLIGFLKSTSSKGIKVYADIKLCPIYKILKENNIQIKEETILTFTDTTWNDCIDTGRSTGGYIILRQAGVVDYGSHLPAPVAMSSGKAEYISAAVACMKASHIKMLEYDFKHLGTQSYKLENPICEPSRIIIDNEAAIAMSKYNKGTAGNRHVARRYHYVHQGTTLNEHKI